MDAKAPEPTEIIRLCGGYAGAISTIMDLTRVLWGSALRANMVEKKAKRQGSRFISKNELLAAWAGQPEVLALISKVLGQSNVRISKQKDHLNRTDEEIENQEEQRKPFFYDLANGQVVFSLELLREFGLVRRVLGDLRPDHELRYYVMRNLRDHYGFAMTPTTVRFLHLLANTVNDAYKPGSKHIIRFYEDFLPRLYAALENDAQKVRDSAAIVNLFVECCREVGYLRIYHFEPDSIVLKTSVFDATYLISNLYGMPTGMKGFDELFGGGIIFAEDLEPGAERALGGRTVLIRGQFGTGKSLLLLQLAAEVARKGGLAWIMPLEQSADECRYTLESINALPNDQSVIIAKNSKEAGEVLAKPAPGRGALIILRTMKESFDDFLAALKDNAARMGNYRLRLMCVDPVNSVNRPETDEAKLRAQMLATLDAIERAGTNVLLVAEEGNDPQKDLLFEQNIADTVINLSVKKEHGYASRIFEISKSRLQREQRGEHPFSIVSGIGIRIYPSSASVNARIRPRSIIRQKDDRVTFGLQSLDNLLGKDAMYRGDVIVFQGAGGSFKTQLGLLFLLGSDWQGHERSLLVAARDNKATVDYLLKQDFLLRFKGKKNRDDINICELPRGHVHPGLILQRIEDELREARLQGPWIDRVMVDNIAHWELSSPFVRVDETFGDTLLDFLRRQRTTNLIVCSDVGNDEASVVQRSIIDGADCVVQFERFEFRGVRRVMVRVLKTRGMKHRREAFELSLTPHGLDIKPSSSLLRIMRDGETATVKIHLFFKTRNSIQQRYNERIIEGLKSVLAEHIENDSKDRIYTTRAKALALSSAVDELQVIQLDEFQLPDIADFENQELLFRFSASQWNEKEWADFLGVDRFRFRGSFFAVPYFHNVSLLAYQKDELDRIILKYELNPALTESWEKLADACARWENDNTEPNRFFFDFPKASTEHFNCLFFEILLCLGPRPSGLAECQLKEWFNGGNAITAAKIFRQLTRRAYIASVHGKEGSQETQPDGEGQVSRNAIVWRHWYTTLNQMLSQMPPSERVGIEVNPLPGNISIAGEWYCGITSYSAAPDVGLEIIKLLTSREAEMDRLQAGVGLPTRKDFYKNSGDGFVSPYFSMNLSTLSGLVDNSFRRSSIGCYVDFSNVLAFHLQRIIEVPDGPNKSVDKSIRAIFKSLQMRFDFMRPHAGCSKCALARH